MTAKEYLNQAYRLDQRINSKIEQVTSLNELATKCTSSLTGMPKAPNQATSTMAEAVTKIVNLQAEINRDIDTLVDLKREIVSVIKQVENLEYQTLLEKRYLCFLTWEQIAVDMGYDLRWLYRLQRRALSEVRVPNPMKSHYKTQGSCGILRIEINSRTAIAEKFRNGRFHIRRRDRCPENRCAPALTPAVPISVMDSSVSSTV